VSTASKTKLGLFVSIRSPSLVDIRSHFRPP
jgi:hypothetical protein